MSVIIISEKPDAALRIAEALAEKKLRTLHSRYGINYYEFDRNGKRHVVVPAVGHLFNLKQKTRGQEYPVLIKNIEWMPSFKVSKKSKFSERYFKTIDDLAKEDSEYIIACDYDNEGSLIGYNILRFICKKEDAKRMFFSTLTKSDLIKSYENIMPHLDWQNINAGETRHFLDWLYGINTTKALTLSIKKHAKRFAILSAGRVQGPTLTLLTERELEIKNFISTPYWLLQLVLLVDGNEIIAIYEKDRIWDEDEARKIFNECKDKPATVDDVSKERYRQRPPAPFNITSLQTEAYRLFGFSPQQTLNIAQSLYTNAMISYPRTSSEKLPPQIGYKQILEALSKINKYKPLCNLLLKSSLRPIEGKGVDPAHEAIHPTVEPPKDMKKLKSQEQKIYDLICRRFLSTFAEDAIRESIKVVIDVDGYNFLVNGKRTIEDGWMKFYGPYANFKELILPDLKKGDKLDVKLELLNKETTPPPRYSQASIIKEMEKRGLGTRCLTADTSIKVLENNSITDIRIDEVFNSSKKLSINDGCAELASSENTLCLSIVGERLDFLKFPLISKRPLEGDENVLEIVFEDGTSIKATEEHPLCVYEGYIKYKPANKLKDGDSIVSIFNNFDKITEKQITWKDFLQLSYVNTAIYGTCDLKSYRISMKMTQYDLARILGITQSYISSLEKTGYAPIWFWKHLTLDIPDYILGNNKKFKIKNPFPIAFDSKLARTLARIIGDGSYDISKIQKENCYDLRYTNKNLELVHSFVTDMEKIIKVNLPFKIKADSRDKEKYYVQMPCLIGRIIALYFKTVLNKMPPDLPKEVYPDFIGALFDDEGHAYRNEPKIFISNTKKQLLEDIKMVLSDFGIKSILTKENEKNRKPNWSASYKLYIRGRYNIQKFLEIIPIMHANKKQRIIDSLSRFYHYGKNKSIIELEKQIMSVLDENGLTKEDIVKLTKISHLTVRTCLKNLRKQGYVEIKTVGKKEQPRKIILYVLKYPKHKTSYSLVGEKVLNSILVTKTIKSIKKSNYDGFVYDITNEHYHNFVLSNGVVSHNSTRSNILQTLYDRNYIVDRSVKVTDLGLKVASTLKKYVPDFVDEKLTKKFEDDLEKIIEGKSERENILKNAEKAVIKICDEFKQNEDSIGKELGEAVIQNQDDRATLGPCSNCGKNLKILFSPRTRNYFVGCTGYKDGCKNMYPLPHNASFYKTNKICDKCKTPIIKVYRKGRRPFSMCLATDCPTKADWGKRRKKV